MKTWLVGTLAVMAMAFTSCNSEALVQDTPVQAEVLASGNSSDIVISLNSSITGVKAKAKYRNRGGEREFQVEVEPLAVGTVVSVCVNGARVGGATADALRVARLTLNTTAGQVVPNIVAGSNVEVRAGATCAGALIASGSF